MTNQAVYGIVNNRAKAEKVIKKLIDEGVDPQDISLLSSRETDFQELERMETTQKNQRDWRKEENLTYRPNVFISENQTKAPEGATKGIAAGSLIGGVFGLLAGSGALAIPGIGPLVAAGPLMSTLSGIGVGGTLGAIIGALVGLGLPEFKAQKYLSKVQEGRVLLSVRVKNNAEAQHCVESLEKQGAEDISVSPESN